MDGRQEEIVQVKTFDPGVYTVLLIGDAQETITKHFVVTR
jgi:hypothetical protein